MRGLRCPSQGSPPTTPRRITKPSQGGFVFLPQTMARRAPSGAPKQETCAERRSKDSKHETRNKSQTEQTPRSQTPSDERPLSGCCFASRRLFALNLLRISCLGSRICSLLPRLVLLALSVHPFPASFDTRCSIFDTLRSVSRVAPFSAPPASCPTLYTLPTLWYLNIM